MHCYGNVSDALRLFEPNYLLNAQTLGDRLNEKDAFDTIIEFKPKSTRKNSLTTQVKRLVGQSYCSNLGVND